MPSTDARHPLPGRQVVRLKEVAAAAGCSTATVSRALNAPGRVTSQVRERVLAAAVELGYVPNSAARALRSRTTKLIGVVIPTLQHAIYARLVDAIRARLTRAGYSLLLTTSDYDLAAEREQGRILLDRGVEAMVLVGDLHDPDLYRLLAEQQVPFVNTYTYGPGSRHPCVGFDNRAATARAAEFLIELGHRDIAMIAGVTRDNDRAAMRLAGVRDMLARHGLELPASRVVESRYTIPGGREGLRALLAAEEAPTAVICGSDILAFGVLIEAASAGLRVPQQMSVVGFDNLEFAAHLSPPLTTVHVPASEMGERAADYLLARLNGHRELACLDLDVSLILRRTTAAPPLDRTS